jgi:hypothetical protein
MNDAARRPANGFLFTLFPKLNILYPRHHGQAAESWLIRQDAEFRDEIHTPKNPENPSTLPWAGAALP